MELIRILFPEHYELENGTPEELADELYRSLRAEALDDWHTARAEEPDAPLWGAEFLAKERETFVGNRVDQLARQCIRDLEALLRAAKELLP